MQDDPFVKAFYVVNIVNRNRAWAEWPAERVKRPVKLLLAVGAAHAVGPDSVPLMLEKRGENLECVQYVGVALVTLA